MIGVNLDYRYETGYPTIDEVRRHGVSLVRCVSLPGNEYWAERYLIEGCRVIAVYTGESEDAGQYVMRNASAVQIGNEPMMQHDAAWPIGGADEIVAVWLRVRDQVWTVHGAWFPLMGPGLWCQASSLWELLADRIEGVTVAAVHVYPEFSGQSDADVAHHLSRYRSVRPDLPLVCTEWTARWPRALSVARTIDTYCSSRVWYTWNDPGQPQHMLAATPELGILTWAR